MTTETRLADVEREQRLLRRRMERLQGDQFANADRLQRRRVERGEPANNDGYFYNTANRRFELKQAPNATTIAHEDTTGRTTDDHHSQTHPIGGTDHTGALTEALHGTLTTLDLHTNFAILAGRAGGQTLIGGTASGEDLTLRGTSHATPGDVIINQDNSALALGAGAGGDARIYYDGSNLIVDAAVIGSGLVLFESAFGIRIGGATGPALTRRTGGGLAVAGNLQLNADPSFIYDGSNSARFRFNSTGTMLFFDENGATRVTVASSTPQLAFVGDVSLGAFFHDVGEIAVPANPGANVRRVFTDSATGELSVRTNAGATVSLETQGVAQSVALLDGSEHTDTAASTVTRGDLIVGNSTPAWADLAIGTARQLLQVNAGGTDPEWASNIDIPGTLDVTGAVVMDSTLNVNNKVDISDDLDVTGHMALGGTAAIHAGRVLRIDEVSTESPFHGAHVNVISNPSSGGAKQVFAFGGTVQWSGSGTSSASNAYAMDFTARMGSSRPLTALGGFRVLFTSSALGTGGYSAKGVSMRAVWAASNAPNTFDGIDFEDLGASDVVTLRLLRLRAQTAPTGTFRAISQEGTVEVNTLAGRTLIGADADPATSAVLELQTTTGALLLPRMTDAQRNALTPVNGMVIYNTTDNVVQAYENGSWVDI